MSDSTKTENVVRPSIWTRTKEYIEKKVSENRVWNAVKEWYKRHETLINVIMAVLVVWAVNFFTGWGWLFSTLAAVGATLAMSLADHIIDAFKAPKATSAVA